MPRRNQRGETYQPLDLTPSEVNMERNNRRDRREPFTPGWQEQQRQRQQDLAERQRLARQNRGIDWSICLVPGCGEPPWLNPGRRAQRRDHTMELPLCVKHIGVAYRQGSVGKDPLVIEAVADVIERRQQRERDEHEADKKRRRQATDGHIYFVRLNGLIKVGWSSDIHERLRAYGPDVEVIVIYPGTRNDETTLHRQFRPVLARGREWYEDHQILHDYAMKMRREQGGTTIHFDGWTRPKEVIGTRRRR